ncbi:cobalamin biosynthesis family protein [Vibrio palustris]|uniref:Adenosylcobinamide-phosphate synthase n=1 Tax=Vibrio palustris TaxID=1918946 RepID=A0A1R4AZT0_9VIBR|nr:cobalamin biosynthesis family protein [Vibrio palustris]SJL82147.1 adenosylcobinamide-phosphate synthase [Vibrio palustris]
MEAYLHLIYANGSLLALWGALLFHLLIPIPHSAHPVTLWHKFAELLASKVNRQHHYQQSYLSGTLAWLFMIIPAIAVLYALKTLVWQPILFELALLLLSLDWRTQETLSRKLITALSAQDKVTARQELAPYVNRNTQTLSALGLGKASAETLIMGFGRNVICVLFWYAILGGIGALTYRLLAELARAWSPSRQEYAPFGLPIVRVVAVLDFIPLRLFSLLLLLGKNMRHTWSRAAEQIPTWPLPGPAWLLCIIGCKLELALGGPAIYGSQKSLRSKVGGRIAPAAIHLSQLQSLLAWRTCAWIMLQSLITAAILHGI